jgi:hypothetical protein
MIQKKLIVFRVWCVTFMYIRIFQEHIIRRGRWCIRRVYSWFFNLLMQSYWNEVCVYELDCIIRLTNSSVLQF